MMRDLPQQADIQTDGILTPSHFAARLDAWLTVERAGYAITLLLALALRLSGLGTLPPNPDEATHALQALAAARGLPFEMAGTTPLLFHLQRVTLTLFASNSFAIRFWPALLGGLSVLFFYAFRRRIGPGGALMAAFLWAISPLAVFSGRLAIGDALVAPLALACAAWLELLWERSAAVRRGDGREDRAGAVSARTYAVLAGVSLALLLLSGPNAYTVLLAAVLVMLIGLAAAGWREAMQDIWQALRPYVRAASLALVLTLGLGATLGFLAPQGLAAAFEFPGRWAQALAPWAGEYGAGELLGRFLMSEVLIIGLGVAGLVTAARRGSAFELAVALFALIALLAAVIGQGRHPTDLTLVVLPLAFLAGPAAALIMGNFPGWSGDLDAWLLAAVNIALVLAAAFCLPGAFNPSNTPTWRNIYLTVGTVTLVLAVLQWVVYAIWGNIRTVRCVLPFVLLVLGIFWTLSQSVGINLDRGAWRRAGVLHEMAASGYRDLEQELGQLAALRGRGAREVSVDLVLTPGKDESLGPMLEWLLRDYPMVQRSAAVPLRPASVVITTAEEQPALASNYSGAEFSLLEHWRPAMLPNAYARLRWVLFRETFAPPEVKNVVLWVRSFEAAPAIDAPIEPSLQAPPGAGAAP